MIAERPKNSEVEEPSLSLFAGLSFPDVPNHPIIRTKQIEAQSIQEREEDEIDSSETSKLLSNELKQPVNTSISSVKKQTNLSALYATEVVTSTSNYQYPELPQITRNISLPSSFQSQKSSIASAPPPQVEEGIQLTPQTSESVLVNELLQENNRLLDEVTRLKAELDLQRRNSSVPSTLSTTSPTTGVSISNPTAPPREGVKYVCCGSCRQWLVAPKDAGFVACSNCDAVNNCNLVQPDRTSHSTQSSAISSTPWFMECFGRIFS